MLRSTLRYLVALLIALVVVGAGNGGALASEADSDAGSASPPNIVYIMLDDVGYGDFGSYGGTFIQTPNIDAFREQGKQFTEYYVNAPICSPTRVSLLTGQYPQKYGYFEFEPFTSFRGIPAEVITFPEGLRTQGYKTAQIGKWHVGLQKPEFAPINQGFDYTVQFQSALAQSFGYWSPTITIDNIEVVPHTGHQTGVITDYAIQYLEDNQDSAEPFFLNMWYLAPHEPLEPPPFWAAQYPNTAKGRYAALLSYADHQIGRILDTIDALGLAENTLVFITSDNGATVNGSNGSLRGLKSQLFEGGIKVPMIARWTGVIEANSTSDSVILGFDIFPTIADLLGVNTSSLDLPGESFLDVMIQGVEKERSSTVFWENKKNNLRHAVRKGPWKLVFHENVYRLFDIVNDPFETIDLLPSRPDVGAELEVEYLEWRLKTTKLPLALGSVEGDVVVTPDTATFGSSGLVTLAPNSMFDFNEGDFTFIASITPTLVDGTDRVIAEKSDSWSLFLGSGNKLTLRVFDSFGNTTTFSGTTAIEADKTYNIAFRSNGFPNRSFLDMYVNHQWEAKHDITPVQTSEATVQLGNDNFKGKPFLGEISNVQMYVTILSSREMRIVNP